MEFLSRLKVVADTIHKPGHGQIKAFSRALGVNYTTVRAWFTEGSQPNATHLSEICNLTGVSGEWLVNGRGDMRGTPQPPPDLEILGPGAACPIDGHQLRAVPIMSDSAAAGDPRMMSENADDYAVIFDLWHGKEQRALRISGESMHPVLCDGDLVGVDVSEHDPRTLDGRIVAAVIDGGVTIKTLTITEDHCIFLAMNPEFKPIAVAHDACRIVGPIIWAWHKFCP